MSRCVIVVGGGSGRRFGGDKLAVEIGGRTVLELAVDRVRHALPEAAVVVVLPAERIDGWRRHLGGEILVAGGARRQDSVRRGAEAAPTDAGILVVHDAARPLVDPGDVRRVCDRLRGEDGPAGAVLCAPIVDTVKRVDGGGRVVATVPRHDLVAALTPQAVRRAALERAWATVPDVEYTDEAALLEAAGMEVATVMAEHPNPKLTVPADLPVVRALCPRPGAGR